MRDGAATGTTDGCVVEDEEEGQEREDGMMEDDDSRACLVMTKEEHVLLDARANSGASNASAAPSNA